MRVRLLRKQPRMVNQCIAVMLTSRAMLHELHHLHALTDKHCGGNFMVYKAVSVETETRLPPTRPGLFLNKPLALTRMRGHDHR